MNIYFVFNVIKQPFDHKVFNYLAEKWSERDWSEVVFIKWDRNLGDRDDLLKFPLVWSFTRDQYTIYNFAHGGRKFRGKFLSNFSR